MREFLKNQRPKLIMFEYLQRTSIADVLTLCKDIDFLVFELSSGGSRIATDRVEPLEDLFDRDGSLVRNHRSETVGECNNDP